MNPLSFKYDHGSAVCDDDAPRRQNERPFHPVILGPTTVTPEQPVSFTEALSTRYGFGLEYLKLCDWSNSLAASKLKWDFYGDYELPTGNEYDDLSPYFQSHSGSIPIYESLTKPLWGSVLVELRKTIDKNTRSAGDFESGHKVQAFVEHANRLVKTGQIDAALDLIYDRIDTFLVKRKFEDVDSILKGVNPERLSVDILLGLLTCTLPARTKLSTRAAFFAEVEREIRKRGEWEDGLLTGLES